MATTTRGPAAPSGGRGRPGPAGRPDPPGRPDARGGATAAEPLDRLGPLARSWRVLLVLLLAAGYVAGSVVGDDHWWPLSPWRMYSTSSAPDGAVRSFALQATTTQDPTWQDMPLSPLVVGINRAELEGRSPLVVARPEVLGTLAQAHARLQPDADAWTGVRLVRHTQDMVGGSPSGPVTTSPVAQWTAAGGGEVLGP